MRVKIDLITGFLGSGKTTFIKQYAAYLIKKGERIGILENDYGAVNVDMMLLNELRGPSCELEMISGGCDYDCHVRRFKTKLIAMAMSGYTRVLVEPSGIFDTDEFFDLIYDEPLDSWYEMGSVITIADAKSFPTSPDGNYLFASQLASSGVVLFSKVTNEQKSELIIKLNTAMKSIGCIREFKDDVLVKDWSTLDDSDFEALMTSGYHSYSYLKRMVMDKNSYSSLYFMNLNLDRAKLEDISKELFQNNDYGSINRVKGFFMENTQWYSVNITRDCFEISPIGEGQNVVIVIGESLNEIAIQGRMATL